jgi:hypothetical protein
MAATAAVMPVTEELTEVLSPGGADVDVAVEEAVLALVVGAASDGGNPASGFEAGPQTRGNTSIVQAENNDFIPCQPENRSTYLSRQTLDCALAFILAAAAADAAEDGVVPVGVRANCACKVDVDDEDKPDCCVAEFDAAHEDGGGLSPYNELPTTHKTTKFVSL